MMSSEASKYVAVVNETYYKNLRLAEYDKYSTEWVKCYKEVLELQSKLYEMKNRWKGNH